MKVFLTTALWIAGLAFAPVLGFQLGYSDLPMWMNVIIGVSYLVNLPALTFWINREQEEIEYRQSYPSHF
jgi:uncharacterized RDD family membrane protein YckC